MYLRKRKAFTMLELIFVIVVIGILSAVAIPKFAMNRDDAIIAKAKNTVAAIRNSVATERQKRILRGDFSLIKRLSSASGTDVAIFDAFDGNTSNPVLQYPLQSCKTATTDGCWRETATTATGSEYTYNMPLTGSVVFELKNNRFDCKDLTDANCIKLTR
jgi:general secretion pathway protein G